MMMLLTFPNRFSGLKHALIQEVHPNIHFGRSPSDVIKHVTDRCSNKHCTVLEPSDFELAVYTSVFSSNIAESFKFGAGGPVQPQITLKSFTLINEQALIDSALVSIGQKQGMAKAVLVKMVDDVKVVLDPAERVVHYIHEDIPGGFATRPVLFMPSENFDH